MKCLQNTLLMFITGALLCGASEIWLRYVGFEPNDPVINLSRLGHSLYSFSKDDKTLGWTNRAGTVISVEAGNQLMHFTAEGARASLPLRSLKNALHTIRMVGGS